MTLLPKNIKRACSKKKFDVKGMINLKKKRDWSLRIKNTIFFSTFKMVFDNK